MKHSTLIGLALLAVCTLPFGTALADEGGPHGANGHHHQAEDFNIPDNAKDIWKAINKKTDSLKKIIDEGKLSGVHEVAFQIRDLAKALPDASKDIVSEDKQGTLSGLIKRIEAHTVNLDKFGDAGEADETKEEYGLFVKRLGHLAKLYPSDVSRAKDGHGDEGHAH